MFESVLNYIGGLPDILMADNARLLWGKSTTGYQDYLDQLSFYSTSKWKDRNFFSLPEILPEFKLESVRPSGNISENKLTYQSRYEVKNPKLKNQFESFKENQKACVHIWQGIKQENKSEVKNPFILCLHGFMMGDKKRAREMFRVSKLTQMGLDVGVYVLPHQGVRNPDLLKQHILDPSNIPLTIETMGQNLHDLHSAVLILKKMGYDKIGIIGASLGGYTLAMYATLIKNAVIDFIFYIVPAVNFKEMLAPKKEYFSFKVTSTVEDLTREALDTMTPENFTPAFDVEKMHVVTHAGDRLNEARMTQTWMKKWKITNFTEVTGGHWLYFDQKARGKAWYGWLKKMGYIK